MYYCHITHKIQYCKAVFHHKCQIMKWDLQKEFNCLLQLALDLIIIRNNTMLFWNMGLNNTVIHARKYK